MMHRQSHILDVLVGQELFGVAFVLDYIRLEFGAPEPDGLSLTLAVPPAVDKGPIIVTTQAIFEWNNPGCRDALCQYLGQSVRRVRIETDQQMIIEFDNDNAVLIPVYSRMSDRGVGIIFHDREGTYSW